MSDENPQEAVTEVAPKKKDRRGAKPGERRGGRGKGSKNKMMVSRSELERIAREAAAEAVKSEVALEVLERKTLPDNKRGKKVLESFVAVFAGMAAQYQPLAPGQTVPGPGQQPDPDKFKEYALIAIEAAKALAPFQDPRYSAVMVGQTQVTKVKVEGGMPDEFSGPGSEYVDLKATEVVSAEEPLPILPKVVNE